MRNFNGIQIQMDCWIKQAGRSSVMADKEIAWIRARGIPLHLRSKELFRSIGDFCGGFLCSDDGPGLAAVRIKVKASGIIPEEVPLCFRAKVFPIRMEVEARGRCPVEVRVDKFFRVCRAKGTGTSVSRRLTPPTVAATPSSSGTTSVKVGSETPVCLLDKEERKHDLPLSMSDKEESWTEAQTSAGGYGRDKDGVSRCLQKDGDVTSHLSDKRMVSGLVREVGLKGHESLIGLQLNANDQLCIVSLGKVVSRGGGVELKVGLAHNKGPPSFGIARGPQSGLLGLFSDVHNEWISLSGCRVDDLASL
ncbi:hypothetical protein LINGRAPRIM_LOCUS576 [Linum grandiflorum]